MASGLETRDHVKFLFISVVYLNSLCLFSSYGFVISQTAVGNTRQDQDLAQFVSLLSGICAKLSACHVQLLLLHPSPSLMGLSKVL
jgi:hypothetical protein